MRKVRLRSQTCSQTRHDLPQDGLKKKKKKSVPLDVKPVCAPDGSFCSTVFSDCRRPDGFFYAHATLAAHMALPNSPGSPGPGKPNPGVIDLGTIFVDSDIIFGFTSHLLKRKTKVRSPDYLRIGLILM
ncbi:putative kinesin-like protein KIF26A-like [Scophthalmus maximus]|uniref:Putative kinesin-like protein KIF26A-like n=1 Tax=Scophthalmus maximus TaxID=52904 RepID=A0A2U9CK24_SCOMX|nr:putative kinesin-like protein KIF26A-like [Scophthalmus maximus]